MGLTARLLVTALACVTLSLSPLESFAEPLQVAVHKVPPDWLTRTGTGPRQTRLGMTCGNKILLGLGIGAGAGLGLLVFHQARGVEVPGEVALTVPVVLGGLGSAFGYNMCR
jgi:hypothetical protein